MFQSVGFYDGFVWRCAKDEVVLRDALSWSRGWAGRLRYGALRSVQRMKNYVDAFHLSR